MPSTFTTNTGIEKPAQGEQSGSWGITVNTNSDIIDRAINGGASLTLTGTSSNITTSNGATSDGQNRVLVLGGTLAATHTITVLPADAQKVYLVKNNTNRTVTFTQGSGASTADVPTGAFGIIQADGSNNCINLTNSTAISNPILGGEELTATGAELNTLDGVNSTLTAAELNTLDGVNATLTAAELNKLDGMLATTDELNVMDGDTNATATTVTASDSIVFNDNGVMKQVSIADINTYIQGQVPLNNSTITITAGNALTGGGSITLNQSADETVTINHQDTSSQSSVNNSGNNFIQDITLDTYGHVTGITSAAPTSIDFGNWTITESSGTLFFATGGSNKMKLDSSGNLTVTGDVTAFGSV